MKKIILMLSICLLAATANAQKSMDEQIDTKKVIQELEKMVSPTFLKKLDSCSPYEHIYKNPFSGTIGKAIVVGQKNNKCNYAIIENGNITKCRIPMELMPKIASEFKDLLTQAKADNYERNNNTSTFQKIMENPNICKEEVIKK